MAAKGLDPAGLRPPLTVSAFLSIGAELETRPLLDRLAHDGFNLCLPVMQGRGQPLIFRDWSPGDPLDAVIWGIEEPVETAPERIPDVVITPLLAFDAQGWRLGYGGGFFDRTLKLLRERGRVLAIGYAFDQQEVDAVPHLDYDERLDSILTPSGLRKVSG